LRLAALCALACGLLLVLITPRKARLTANR
jgi:hypothetical protein